MLARERCTLNEITKDVNYEKQLLVSHHDNREHLMVMGKYISSETLNWYRDQFKDEALFKKDDDEKMYESLIPFNDQNIIPGDGESYPGDIIRVNLGHEVLRANLKC